MVRQPESLSFSKKWMEKYRSWDRRFLSSLPSFPMGCTTRSLLHHSPIWVADVGSAGGVDEKWERLGRCVGHWCFEPRDSKMPNDDRHSYFTVALSDRSEVRTLNILSYEESSSLYEPDREVLNRFIVGSAFEKVGEIKLTTTTLDQLVEEFPDRAPVFLKLDVEGAELEVLRGSDSSLKERILGVNIEVSFNRRLVNGPLFSQLDKFLREHDFDLFSIKRVSMLRLNRFNGGGTMAQVMWGDALYFRNLQSILLLLSQTPIPHRSTTAVRYLVLLINHHLNDTAFEALEAFRAAGHLSEDVAKECDEMITQAYRSVSTAFWRFGIGVVLAFGIRILTWPLPSLRPIARAYLGRRVSMLLRIGCLRWERGGYRGGNVTETDW